MIRGKKVVALTLRVFRFATCFECRCEECRGRPNGIGLVSVKEFHRSRNTSPRHPANSPYQRGRTTDVDNSIESPESFAPSTSVGRGQRSNTEPHLGTEVTRQFTVSTDEFEFFAGTLGPGCRSGFRLPMAGKQQ